jgi:phosphate transport system substrate-binding protein
MNKNITFLVVSFLPLSLLGCTSTQINGAGATFPNPIYQKWFGDFSQKEGAKINYQSVGSGAGVRQFVNGTVDFAATDEPIKAKDSSKVGAGVVQIPLTAGTIAIAYNKEGCTLRLKQSELVSLFDGSIKDWSYFGCSPGPVTTVHRADGSGTTAVFTQSLSAFSDSWKKNYGSGKSVKFPMGLAAKGNEGVSGTIKMTPGTIGYVNLSYAKEGRMQIAALENRERNFVYPTPESGTEALKYIQLDPSTLAGSNPNPKGPNSYPITSLTWILAYKNHNGPRTETIKNLLYYSLSAKAQAQAAGLGYIPLSPEITLKAQQAVSLISK